MLRPSIPFSAADEDSLTGALASKLFDVGDSERELGSLELVPK